uniref:Uncharacterized protein n=1 Tax=Panagrolaimus davidi TaxID=227884 RepID=A0A914PFU8_9BILA
MRLILFLCWISLIFAKNAFHYSLSEHELRDIISDTEYDSEEAEEFGKQIHSFFHESNSQLILDLDLFTQFWKELDEARASAIDGNVDYIKEIITFLKPLQKYDISAPCLADVFHFLWTTYNYAGQYCLARFYVHNKNSPLKAFDSDVKPDPAEVCRSQSNSYEDWLPEEKSCFDRMPLLNVGFCMPGITTFFY